MTLVATKWTLDDYPRMVEAGILEGVPGKIYYSTRDALGTGT